MLKKILRIFLTLGSALTITCLTATAGDGGSYSSYAPYSIFGVGNMVMPGSAYNRTMGGVGIASRNNRYINFLNPAAVTARDTLAFMSDYSVFESNTLYRQGDLRSVNNTFNVNNIVFSFPLYKSSAMMVGIRPYSGTGYSYGYYETDPAVIIATGNAAHAYSGQGSMYQLFATVGATFFKRLSVGAEYIHYFGNIKKTYTQSFSDEATLPLNNIYNMQLSANTAKLGLQYEQPLGNKFILGVGATYLMSARLNGYSNSNVTCGETVITSVSDTLANRSTAVNLASELGFGISVNYMNKFRAEFDYTRSDWSGCGFENALGFAVNKSGGSPMFTGTVSEAYRLGFEYLPNLNDLRYYYKKIAYRAGVFYKTDYFNVEGNQVTTKGITLGATLPVFRWYNGLTVGMEFGQRGTIKNNLIRETYVGFNLGVNLHDIWFRKFSYE